MLGQTFGGSFGGPTYVNHNTTTGTNPTYANTYTLTTAINSSN